MTYTPKPKTTRDPHMAPVLLTAQQRQELCDLLGRRPQDIRAEIADLQALLARLRHGWNRARLKPLPAHLRAELAPIAKRAQELADLLAPDRLTPEAMAALIGGVDLRALWFQLEEVAHNAATGLAQAGHPEAGPSDGGAIERHQAAELDHAAHELGRAFDALAVDATAEERAEFIAKGTAIALRR